MKSFIDLEGQGSGSGQPYLWRASSHELSLLTAFRDKGNRLGLGHCILF